MKRRGHRVKTGPNSYLNVNGKGQVTSSTYKAGNLTINRRNDGSTKTTANHGSGYYDSWTSNKPAKTTSRIPKAPRQRSSHARSDSKDADFLFFLIGAVFRLVFWLLKQLFIGTVFVLRFYKRRLFDNRPVVVRGPAIGDDKRYLTHVTMRRFDDEQTFSTYE